MITVIQKPCHENNWKPGPHPRDVRAFPIHVTEGSLAATDSWFNNPRAVVSAAFCVGKLGQLHQYVGIHDIAYTNGRVARPTWTGLIPGRNPNDYTLGIEHEGDGKAPWPANQILTSAILAAWLCERFQRPVNAVTFPLHREIFADKTCPGPAFNREHYLDCVQNIRRLFGPNVKTLITGIR